MRNKENESKMLEFIIGAAVGAAGGFIAKSQVLNQGKTDSTFELTEAEAEVKRLKARNDEYEKEIEEQSSKIKDLTERLRNQTDVSDDKSLEYDTLQAKLKRIENENDDLRRELTHYKKNYESVEAELNRLKNNG